MMPVGYYVPTMMMTHHNGAVYYNQQQQLVGGDAGYQAYYDEEGGYAPYGMDPNAAFLQYHEGSPGQTLNIDAPEFNPKENNHE